MSTSSRFESQRRAALAQQEGRFAKSLFPVCDSETGTVLLERDEYPRPSTTLEGLAQLNSPFAALGAMPFGFNGETPISSRSSATHRSSASTTFTQPAIRVGL